MKHRVDLYTLLSFPLTSGFFEFSTDAMAGNFTKKWKIMKILLDEKLVLMKKAEKYPQNCSYSVHNLVKSIFLDEEKKTRKNYA